MFICGFCVANYLAQSVNTHQWRFHKIPWDNREKRKIIWTYQSEDEWGEDEKGVKAVGKNADTNWVRTFNLIKHIEKGAHSADEHIKSIGAVQERVNKHQELSRWQFVFEGKNCSHKKVGKDGWQR